MDEKTVESARAEFEKWVKNPHMLGRCHAPGSEDRYEVSETQYAWRAWQAAIAAYRDAEIERLTASLVHWKRLADEACRGEMLALKEKHDLRAKLEAAEARLTWMIERSARVVYSMDGEECWVDYETREIVGRGYARATCRVGKSPIESIDAARGGEHG